jgi:integrase/recombinase XerD
VKNSSLPAQYYSRLIALERRSPLTAETYGLEIRRFLEWLAGEGLEVEAVDAEGISRYLELRRSADGIDSRSAAKAISALRSFFRFTMDENIRQDNPAAILEIPRRGIHLPEVLSREKVESILAAIDTGTPRG